MLYALSVGGADASQNGFGERIPATLQRRSAMGGLRSTGFQCAIDGKRGQLAVLHRHHGEVLPAAYAIATCPDAGDRGPALTVHGDARAGQLEQIAAAVQTVGQQDLTDRLE